MAPGKPLWLSSDAGCPQQAVAVPCSEPHPRGVQDPGDTGQPGAPQGDILHAELFHSVPGMPALPSQPWECPPQSRAGLTRCRMKRRHQKILGSPGCSEPPDLPIPPSPRPRGQSWVLLPSQGTQEPPKRCRVVARGQRKCRTESRHGKWVGAPPPISIPGGSAHRALNPPCSHAKAAAPGLGWRLGIRQNKIPPCR